MNSRKFFALIFLCAVGLAVVVIIRVRHDRPSSAAKNNDGPLFIISKQSKAGYIDRSGQTAISLTFDEGRNFSENLAAVRMEGLWGYINRKGDVVIPPQFTETSDFHEGLAFVSNGPDRLWGVINSTGGMVVFPRFNSSQLPYFSSGFALIREGNAACFVDRNGISVFDCFNKAEDFSGELASVMINNLWGAIDRAGQIVVPAEYEIPLQFSEDRAPVKLNDGLHGYIDSQGQLAIPARFRRAGPFRDGLAAVEEQGKRGYIDRNGTVAFWLDLDVEWTDDFSEGRATVHKKEKVAYIDKHGSFVTDFLFVHGAPFQNGLARVSLDKYPLPPVMAYIDLEGRLVWWSGEK